VIRAVTNERGSYVMRNARLVLGIASTCVALLNLELSRTVDEVTIVELVLRLRQQQAEANVGLDEQALHHSRIATDTAGQALRAASGDTASDSDCDDDIALSITGTSQTFGLVLAPALVESTTLAETAAPQLAQHTARRPLRPSSRLRRC
jgi:hypothetical protein